MSPKSAEPSLAAQIAHLPHASLAELKDLWRQLFGRDATVFNRAFLERRIAYRLQERALEQSDPALLDHNRRRIDQLRADLSALRSGGGARLLPGTVVSREHQGVMHRVMVLPDGRFEWRGQPYRSLSVIARAITGTRWSGPAFFGVKPATKVAAKRGEQR